MQWVHDTMAEFGRQLGLDRLGFGGHGVVQLQMDSGSMLVVEPVQRGARAQEVLVCLARPAGHRASRALVNGLAKVHFRSGGGWPIQLATRGTGPDVMLLAVVRLPERAFTPAALHQVFDYLLRWLDEVQAA